eukprot:TRINITY_DN17354_c0_g1_i1.p1 TRINITY_DN17354_c0_g1~~TRINITY_DN17354_c0_g1_i1.p1  ORF type:complete len:460 (+),score=70.38 TRINITY_DN17354_c0_g1_i1:65-1381(+)
MATAEGTRRILARAVERGVLHPRNVRTLGPSANTLSCSALGFGAYRIGGGDSEASHASALRAALQAGVNLVDTSSHYAAPKIGIHGASERLVGQTLAAAIAAGDVAREEVIVCTKVGHVEGGVKPPSDAVQISGQGDGGNDGLAASDHWHSIGSDFVEAEVRASGERLGTPPDFVLLHNPEYFLSARLRERIAIGDAWDEMYGRLAEAFRSLERLCDEGAIGSGYGLSANFLSCLFSTTGRANTYEALMLDRVVDAAKAASGGGGKPSRLHIAQMPLNAIESGAALGRGRVVPDASEGDLTLAGRLGLAVVTNRPLQAIPIPGASSGDWGRGNSSYVHIREAKPIGAVAALIQRILRDAIAQHGGNAENIPLQQLSAQLALSAPSVTCTLLGMRAERYVSDASDVLRAEPLKPEVVSQVFQAVREAMDEMGGQRRGLW